MPYSISLYTRKEKTDGSKGASLVMWVFGKTYLPSQDDSEILEAWEGTEEC